LIGSSSWQKRGGARRTNLWSLGGAFEHLWGITPKRRRRGRGERGEAGGRPKSGTVPYFETAHVYFRRRKFLRSEAANRVSTVGRRRW
jgi:hypothetical protein